MAKEEILKKIKDFMVEEFKIDEGEITNDATFLEDLGFDSLDVSTLLQDVEDMFDIRIPDEDLEKIDTVGKLVDYIEDKQS